MSRGEYEDEGSAVSEEGWPDSVVGELEKKAFGLKPSDEDSCASGSRCVGACGFGCSVAVMVFIEDAREGGDGGGRAAAAAVGLSADGWGGGSMGELGFSSGFAMRSPPSDCERLRSPFIMAGVLANAQRARAAVAADERAW